MASEIIILGSGSSTGVPTPLCVVQPSDPPCSVCHKAIQGPPELNKNYRCNPSIMIKYCPLHEEPSDKISDLSLRSNSGRPKEALEVSPKYIQIDCGKCFKEQVLRWYIHHKIPRMDALILTHEHADAMLGLDDIRGLQPFHTPEAPVQPTPVFVTQHTMDSVIEKFGYLVSKEQQGLHSKHQVNQAPLLGDINGLTLGNGVEKKESPPSSGEKGSEGNDDKTKPAVFRRVTQLHWRVILPVLSRTFEARGLEFTPLPVMHGEDYVSLGFEFGAKDRVLYISDVSRIPEGTMAYLKEQQEKRGRAKVLIVDALHYSKPHETHFSMPETLQAILEIQPLSAYMIGMTHQFDHDLVNKELQEWSSREGIKVELSYDGMTLPVDL